MKLIVADTGPLLHLHEAGALHLFAVLGEVHVTPAVLRELERHAPGIWIGAVPASLRFVHPTATANVRAAQWIAGGLLDAGEAESLAYAEEMKPDLFVTDDAAARLMADSLSMPARGSLGVILFCAVHGHLSRQQADEHLRAIAEKSTLWLSSRVRKAAAEVLAEIFR